MNNNPVVSLSITILFAFVLLSTTSVAAQPRRMITILPIIEENANQVSPWQCALAENETELELLLGFSTEQQQQDKTSQDGPVTGDYLIFLDNLPILNGTLEDSSKSFSTGLPVTTLQSGEHLLRCEFLRPSGEIYTDTIRFLFDGSPLIAVSVTEEVHIGYLDPLVSIDVAGHEPLGFIDVFLDDHLVQTSSIDKEHIGRQVRLSAILGKTLSTAELAHGTHLMTIMVHSTSGDSSSSYSTFRVDSTPELQIITDDNGSYQEAVTTFLLTDLGFSGNVEVFLDQTILLVKSVQTSTISIPRDEIVAGMKKLNMEHHDLPLNLVFALRAANGSEYWRKVEFR